MKKGYIKLQRQIFEHYLWNEKREYSKFEAWLDLIQSARYQSGIGKNMMKGKFVEWQRGQLIASTRFLMKRWNWKSPNKVRSFLDLLVKDKMITVNDSQGINCITLLNYEKYNCVGNEEEIEMPIINEIKHPLQLFIKENLPSVNKLRQQLSIRDCEKLLNDYDKKIIYEILEDMENYKALTTKYKSVNLTLRKWIKLRLEKKNEFRKAKGDVTQQEFNSTLRNVYE